MLCDLQYDFAFGPDVDDGKVLSAFLNAYAGHKRRPNGEPDSKQAGCSVLLLPGCDWSPERVVLERFEDWKIVARPGGRIETPGGTVIDFSFETEWN